MDIKTITPFLDAIVQVMPQLGFKNVKRGQLSVSDSNKIANLGVMAVIGITHEIRGTIAYNMTEASAKKIVSQMMMGMAVPNFDEMAESAISELSNMLAAHASIAFEQQGAKIDISPPTLIVGNSDASAANNMQRIIIEVFIDDLLVEVHISVST